MNNNTCRVGPYVHHMPSGDPGEYSYNQSSLHNIRDGQHVSSLVLIDF